jgi:ornithine cyclodeaminase
VNALREQGLRVSAADSLEALASKCELIVTTTSATTPLLRSEWIRPGTHITAVGSDTPEKHELETSLMALADRVVCDSLEQCRLRGEVAQALQSGDITEDGVVELGAVLSGSAEGRRDPLEVSICDLTGVAVQDLHIAEAVHRAQA